MEATRLETRRITPLWLGFAAFAVALAFAVPENLYSSSAFIKEFADGVASVFGSIDEFARYSRFPGTTRVVLAVLWTCVPILAWVQWRYPGFIPNIQLVPMQSRIYLSFVVVIVVALVVWPMLMLEITPEQLEGPARGRRSIDWIIRLVVAHRLWLGLFAGFYCVITAWFLACLPGMLKRFTTI